LKVMNGVEVISNRFKMNGIEWKQVELIWNDWYWLVMKSIIWRCSEVM
jgi:hypothetical protein